MFALHSLEASLVLEHAGEALLWRHLGLRVGTAGLPPLASTRGAATFSLDEDVPFAAAPGAPQQPGGLLFPLPPLLTESVAIVHLQA